MSRETFDWLLYVVEYEQRKKKIQQRHMFEREIRDGKLALLEQERRVFHMRSFGKKENRRK
jgi:hypothetical protein